MTLTTTVNVLDEMIQFLRNNLTDPSSRGTNTTQSYTATAGQTEFVITTNYPFNVSSVTKNAVTLSFGTDYTFNYDTKTLTLTAGATVGDAIVISYHYSETWIFPDYPRQDLSISSYPRICVSALAESDDVLGLSLDGMGSVFTFTVSLFFDNRRTLLKMKDTIKQLLWTNKKSFYYVIGVFPVGSAGPMLDPTRKGEIYVYDMDFSTPIQPQS
jgi:hypothetical protein